MLVLERSYRAILPFSLLYLFASFAQRFPKLARSSVEAECCNMSRPRSGARESAACSAPGLSGYLQAAFARAVCSRSAHCRPQLRSIALWCSALRRGSALSGRRVMRPGALGFHQGQRMQGRCRALGLLPKKPSCPAQLSIIALQLRCRKIASRALMWSWWLLPNN